MPTGLRSFEAVESSELHAELGRLERAATVGSQGYWFALLVVGAITMFSPERSAVYWVVAVPAGVAAIIRFYRRRGLPVAQSSVWYPMITVWLVGGVGVVADLPGAAPGRILTYTMIGLGFALLAGFERSWILAGTAGATPLLAVLVSTVDAAEPPTYPAAIGFSWFFVGFVVWLYRY